jgi:hypothetical protein
MRALFGVAGAALCLAAPAAAVPLPSAEARVLIASLETQLAARDSATDTLRLWCGVLHLADPPQIAAQRAPGPDKPADAEVRRLLHAAPDEPIRYRRVALTCGGRVLSNADNWYRPGRLTAVMNAELDATDHPFGSVVKPLRFHRVTLDDEVLLPPGDAPIPADVIRHRALLETPDREPFSLVVETYTAHVLDVGAADPPPRPIKSISVEIARPPLPPPKP